jgi:glycosyltransferase involved in cell wall biosynthesis
MNDSQENLPKASVLMSVYKESVVQISTAIKSILNQTFSEFEFIIVLDDPANTEAKILLEKIKDQDSRVKLIFNKENIALGASLNKAIDQSVGEYLIRMDADDVSYPERIAEQVNFMNRNRELDLSFTQWEEFSGLSNSEFNKKVQPVAKDFNNLKKNFFVKSILLHPTMIARREVFEKNKYLETTRPEDVPLFMKLIRENYQFGLLEKVLYRYKTDKDNPKVYFIRIIFEYLISRNYFIFKLFYGSLTFLWKKVFGFVIFL